MDLGLTALGLQQHREGTVLVGSDRLDRVHDDADGKRIVGHLGYWFLLFARAANYTAHWRQASDFWAILTSGAGVVAGLMSIWYKSVFPGVSRNLAVEIPGLGSDKPAGRNDSNIREEFRCPVAHLEVSMD